MGPMGAGRGVSSHTRTPIVCSCSVSPDQTAVTTLEPHWRFNLPPSFSGPALARSVEALAAPAASPLAGHTRPPDQPPQA